MGIKTKFNPMGGRSISSEPDLGNLSLWRYSNDVVAGKTLLYNYVGNGTNAKLYGYSWWLGEPNISSDIIYYLKVDPPVEGANIYYANGTLYSDYVSNIISEMGYFKGTIPSAAESQWYWRNYSTDIDLGLEYPDPLYVPKAKGKAIINNWVSAAASGTTDANRNTPFFNNKNIVSVDFQGVDFRSNSMSNAFNGCNNLTSIVNISNSVTSMSNTFAYCYNLNQNIQIPSSVTNMSHIFYNCRTLNQNIQIPNSVTSMEGTFSGCNNLNQKVQVSNSVTSMSNTFNFCFTLNQNIQIPSSVTNMSNTFNHCSSLNQNIQIPNSVRIMVNTFASCFNLNQNIQIPSSVTNMSGTFTSCNNLNQNIQIPSSVTDMSYTFYNCRTLNQNIQIPSSVTNMYYTFAFCSNLEGRINILSVNVTNATDCFTYSNKYKNVYYHGGSETVRAFMRAGYIYNNGRSTGKDNTSFWQFF